MTQEQFNEMMNVYLQQLASQDPSEWSENARIWGENLGLIQGDENGNKAYKKLVTREEMVQVLSRLFSQKTTE